MKTLQLKENFYWTGMQDPELKVFDIIMETEFGTTYNSYLLKGSEKTALFETCKQKCMDEYLEKLTSLVDIKDIDYIIVNHTEPDHAGSAFKLVEMNPSIKIVGTGTAIKFLKEITNADFASMVVKNGDTLSLGNKTLEFITLPNLHWPDTMYTYVQEDKTLITCDSFGSHYSFDHILQSEIKDEEGYLRALKYYFDNILGPFKNPFLLKAIAKISDYDIDMICPGHGPVLDSDPWKIVDICEKWSAVENPNEKKTVVIPYVAAYGYTAILADKIAEGIQAAGDIDVKKFDMVVSDSATVLGEIAWADGVLFGTPTILGEALKPIWDLTTSMFPPIHGGKIASAFGSYGWSGEGVPHIIERLRQLRLKVYGEGLKVPFNPSATQLEEAYEFGYNFGLSVLEGAIVEPKKTLAVQKWKCLVCGEIIEGPEPPAACPVCSVGPEQFVAVEEEDSGFTSDEDMRFVVVGGGTAALSAVESIRKINKVASIELISNEDVYPYVRPQLTKGLLSGFDGLDFFPRQKAWYDENRIITTLGTEVTAIDTATKKITLTKVNASGGYPYSEERCYDRLILALGAECNRPPMTGDEKDGIFVIRKLADVNAIRDRLDTVNNVVLIGGGVLGLEAAWEFVRAGKKVTILDRETGPMARQLDDTGSHLLLNAIRNAGCNFIMGTFVDTIIGYDKVQGIRTKDGNTYPADMIIISAGNAPNVTLAQEAGIHTNRFIDVNEHMETSAPAVYAAGDCAAVNNVSVGIFPQAKDMGTVAGAVAAGDRERSYTPVVPSNAFSGFKTQLFAIGDAGKSPDKKYKSLELRDDAKGLYKKLYFVNGRFVGGILLGDVSQGAMLVKAYSEGTPAADLLPIITK